MQHADSKPGAEGTLLTPQAGGLRPGGFDAWAVASCLKENERREVTPS